MQYRKNHDARAVRKHSAFMAFSKYDTSPRAIQRIRAPQLCIKRTSGSDFRRGVLLSACLALLTGCSETGALGFLQPRPASEETVARANTASSSGQRDVESPQVFEAKDSGLWDGRPSLGGVWVAHPDVTDPERVIIRNQVNGKSVVGALFRREYNSPGPVVQISSDAATELGILAGSPTDVHITALRREEVADPAPSPDASNTQESATTDLSVAPSNSSETNQSSRAPQSATNLAEAVDASIPTPTSSLSKPYVQIGIFSIEQNAQNTATAMTQSGLEPRLKKQSYDGKTFWRVLVGPAQTSSDLSHMLKTAKGKGFSDAYAVKS